MPGQRPEDAGDPAGFEHGRIVRFEPDGNRYQAYAETGGRPLGLHFDSRGNLIVADAERGLLSVPPRGEVKVFRCFEGNL